MSSENLSALRDFAAELAWHAGRLTMRYFQTGVAADTKADESPVTIADRESERLMRRMIEEHYPQHSILGEEEGETRPGATFRWILDPIDGTKTFVRGVPFYAVLVGLEREGVAVVGAVNLPATGDFLSAAQGEGCTWNGRRARVSQVAALSEAALMSTDVDSFAKYGREAAFQRLLRAAKMHRTWGDAYGHVLVATGRADIAIDPVMNAWDCAALLPVLQEAGGTFTDWRGTPTIHGGEAISTNGRILTQVLALVGERE